MLHDFDTGLFDLSEVGEQLAVLKAMIKILSMLACKSIMSAGLRECVEVLHWFP